MRRTFFALCLALASAAAAADVQQARILLRMESNHRLAAHAVADLQVRREGDRVASWRMVVTYYLAGRSGRADGLLTRVYGDSVGNMAGPDNLSLDLTPMGAGFTLPLPSGERAVMVTGGRGPDGKWAVGGTARFKGKGTMNHWSAVSVRSFQWQGDTLSD